jgi:hypothetical protein
MGIFAGAPLQSPDPWVVVPKGPRMVQSTIHEDSNSPTRFRRQGAFGGIGAANQNRLSRNFDAVIDDHRNAFNGRGDGGDDSDDEVDDVVGPLAQPHKFRRRGLSDSSIHSTYLSQADEDDLTERNEGGNSSSAVEL